MHPWPNHGESYWTTESAFTSNTSLGEAGKRMTKVRAEAMGKGLTNPATNHDVPVGMSYLSLFPYSGKRLLLTGSVVYLASPIWDDHIHGAGCTCGDMEGINIDRSYSFFDTEIWPSIKTRGFYCCILGFLEFKNADFVKEVNFGRDIITRDSDAFSVEEKGELKPDTLPWSNASKSSTDIWLLPHPCSTECWHKDPVEVAALRYERAGRFRDASKLRVDFRGLSILHRRVLQWYRWAENQWALKGASRFLSCDITRRVLSSYRP